jgi:hypothetical protein
MNPDSRFEASAVAYEPPIVERVIDPAEIEREVLYAGKPTDTETPV